MLGVTKLSFDAMKAFPDRHGKLMHGGTVVDETIIDAPTSTKNADKARDPEMYQVPRIGFTASQKRLVSAGTPILRVRNRGHAARSSMFFRLSSGFSGTTKYVTEARRKMKHRHTCYARW